MRVNNLFYIFHYSRSFTMPPLTLPRRLLFTAAPLHLGIIKSQKQLYRIPLAHPVLIRWPRRVFSSTCVSGLQRSRNSTTSSAPAPATVVAVQEVCNPLYKSRNMNYTLFYLLLTYIHKNGTGRTRTDIPEKEIRTITVQQDLTAKSCRRLGSSKKHSGLLWWRTAEENQSMLPFLQDEAGAGLIDIILVMHSLLYRREIRPLTRSAHPPTERIHNRPQLHRPRRPSAPPPAPHHRYRSRKHGHNQQRRRARRYLHLPLREHRLMVCPLSARLLTSKHPPSRRRKGTNQRSRDRRPRIH